MRNDASCAARARLGSGQDSGSLLGWASALAASVSEPTAPLGSRCGLLTTQGTLKRLISNARPDCTHHPPRQDIMSDSVASITVRRQAGIEGKREKKPLVFRDEVCGNRVSRV